MRPKYAFETKKPTKSTVYRKPADFSPWSKNGTRIKFTQKKLPRFTAKQPRKTNN